MVLFMKQINEIDTDTLMFEDDDVTLSEVPEEDIDAANLHILHELEEVWMWQFLFTEHNRSFHLFIHLLQNLKEICRNFSSLQNCSEKINSLWGTSNLQYLCISESMVKCYTKISTRM